MSEFVSHETVTADAFPHGIQCAECEKQLWPGDAVAWVLRRVANVEIPVVPLAEVYAGGATDDAIFVGLCELCASLKVPA